MRAGLLLALFLVAGAIPVNSQTDRDARGGGIDSLLQRPTHVHRHARVEDETGIARAVYQPRRAGLTLQSDDETARSILKLDRRIGWSGRDEDLRVIDERRSPGGRHLTYQQFVDDVPVLGRFTRVSVDRAGRPTFIVNAFAPHVDKLTDFDTSPRVTASEAQARSESVFPEPYTRLGDTELVVVPLERPRLSWKTLAWPAKGGEYEIHVDAHNGEIFGVTDLTLHRSSRPAGADERPSFGPVHPVQAVESAAGVMVDGEGLVFDPDPLATSGKGYAPPYVDSDDADIPELNAERKVVSLPDITLGPDQLHRLIGPYVEVTGRRSNGQVNYTPPEESSAAGFAYTRGDERFESVMVYYHIDKSQRYVQSLGFDDVQNGPVPVNPFGEGNADISNYYLGQNYLAFGGGSIDDAEDAFVIWHEYAHALLNARVPGLANTYEGTALHEGWSDYWAASYQREMFEDGLLPSGNWKRFFRWDGNNPPIEWFGRTLPDFKVYPTDLIRSNVHIDGLVWASAVMAVYDRLGRRLTDQLNIQSHYYLTAAATMEDAAYALVQADVDLYGGEHAVDLVQVLSQRGFVDGSLFRTAIEHEPLADTEQLGGSVEVVAEITSIVSEVTSATIHYEGGGASGSTSMTTDDGVVYRGAIPLPNTPSVVSYYIEVSDDLGQITRLPEGAPDASFDFVAGPDSEPPVISHLELTKTSIYGWPPLIKATITDNVTIDTVFVEFVITDDETSAVLVDSSFGLTPDGDEYSGSFPEVDVSFRGRETVAYRIHAIDGSSSKNKSVLPLAQDAPFVFRLSITGTVVQYDFEQNSEEIVGTGSWERGTPAFGPLYAHSGTSAWVTNLDGPYPAAQATSSLTLPPVALEELDTALLQFWHWYDFEHDGTAEPGSNVKATLWDGGNVLVSLDDGATWNIVTPDGGYDGVISSGVGNPKGGQPAFGGYSYGWRREIVEIPGGPSVTVRFDFGSDVSNNEPSIAYTGWMIDDVVFMVDRPADDEAPEVLEAPPALTEVSSGVSAAPATVRFRLSDDTGIESARASYSISGPNGSGSGTVRLAMSFVDPTRFSADVPVPATAAVPGTIVDYEMTVRDFDGNEIVLPGGNQRYRFAYILVEETDVVSAATPSGGWSPSGQAWRIDASNHRGSDASLVFSPTDLPVDANSIEFELTHSFRLQSGAVGRLAVSTGDAGNWEPIDPENGYPNGSQVFVGLGSDVTSVYELDSFAGRHLWIRLDMAAEAPLSTADFWDVSSARLVYKGSSSDFEVPRSLELHPNYPNPFSEATTITYSLPAPATVRIEAFDVLGRRVETLRDEMHQEGTHSLRWQPNIAPGVYMIRLEADGREKHLRVTLTR